MTVVRALCVFYYEKSALGEKVRNRMRAEAVKMESSITRKGKKCPNLVIESIVIIKIRIHFRCIDEVNPYFLFVKPKI